MKTSGKPKLKKGVDKMETHVRVLEKPEIEAMILTALMVQFLLLALSF